LEDKNKRFDNTVNIISDILEENMDKANLKDVYMDVQRLKNKRNIK